MSTFCAYYFFSWLKKKTALQAKISLPRTSSDDDSKQVHHEQVLREQVHLALHRSHKISFAKKRQGHVNPDVIIGALDNSPLKLPAV